MYTARFLITAMAALACVVTSLPAQSPDEEVMRIAAQVRRQIVRLNNYSLFDDIAFGIKSRTVTLRGQASRPTLKKSAERVVSAIEGVDKVVNEIEVLPVSPQDDRIRAAAYMAIYRSPPLSRYDPNRGSPLFRSSVSRVAGITEDPPIGFHPIHIIVKNGHLTLEGVVDNSGDKTIAGLRANQVNSVFSVNNDLVVANAEAKAMMGDKKGGKDK